MPLSMCQASLPVLLHGLSNLSAILKKAQSHAQARKIEPSVFMNARLAPDMFPLSRQVQIACDLAKGCAARLSGMEPPSYPDEEKSFEELETRIQKTVAFLKTVKAERIDGGEERDVTLKIGGKDMTFKAQPYLLYFAMPNFYFHLTATYAILRHNGVELSKQDFIGTF